MSVSKDLSLARCASEGCAALGAHRVGDSWHCANHAEGMKAARLREVERENMIRGYTQSIYAGWVSHDFSLLDDDEAVIREACRRIRRVARIAAEVLFEEEEKP